jgi:hypothetical protein
MRETFEPELLTGGTVLVPAADTQCVVEVGPRMSFSTAFSTNATSICRSCGLSQVGGRGGRGLWLGGGRAGGKGSACFAASSQRGDRHHPRTQCRPAAPPHLLRRRPPVCGAQVTRLEVSRRYLLTSARPLTAEERAAFASLVGAKPPTWRPGAFPAPGRALAFQPPSQGSQGAKRGIARVPCWPGHQPGAACGSGARQPAVLPRASRVPSPAHPCPPPPPHTLPQVHDRMTEQVYERSATSFAVDTAPAPVFSVPVLEKGRGALEKVNSVSLPPPPAGRSLLGRPPGRIRVCG